MKKTILISLIVGVILLMIPVKADAAIKIKSRSARIYHSIKIEKGKEKIIHDGEGTYNFNKKPYYLKMYMNFWVWRKSEKRWILQNVYSRKLSPSKGNTWGRTIPIKKGIKYRISVYVKYKEKKKSKVVTSKAVYSSSHVH